MDIEYIYHNYKNNLNDVTNSETSRKIEATGTPQDTRYITSFVIKKNKSKIKKHIKNSLDKFKPTSIR